MPYVCRRCNNGTEFECGYSEYVRLRACETGIAYIDAWGETQENEMNDREITDTEDSYDFELTGNIICSRCRSEVDDVDDEEYDRLFPPRPTAKKIQAEQMTAMLQIKEKIVKGGRQNGSI